MVDGDMAARSRLEALFRAIDRLTPDELAGIGYRLPPDEARAPLLAAVEQAARETGREALVDQARAAARDAVLTRFSAGSLHPTFAGLNWGLSQGTVESRVAIAETLADAAAAAVVEDALDPEVAAALSLNAAAITDLASGEATAGSLAQVLRVRADPELRPPTGARQRAVVGLFIALVITSIAAGAGGLVVGVVAVVAGIRAMVGRRERGGG